VNTVEALLEQYAKAYRSGESDPVPFLDQAPEDQRDELGNLIELFLMRADPPEWDPKEFAKSDAAPLTERILPEILVPERGWCDMLPGLRMRQQRTRRQIGAELAADLKAVGGKEKEKVADYYHDMEQGNLKPQGVSRKVLDSLAEIYGTTVEALRRAGERTRPSGDADGVVYARTFGDADQGVGFAGFASPEDLGFSRISGEPDRIDRLFTDPGYDDPDR
jgi:hypothetical protein